LVNKRILLTTKKKNNLTQFNCYTLSQILGTGVVASVGVKTGWIMETSLLLSFFGEESQNGETASKFLAKIPSFFFSSKRFLQTPTYFRGACRHKSVSQSVYWSQL